MSVMKRFFFLGIRGRETLGWAHFDIAGVMDNSANASSHKCKCCFLP